MVRFGFGTVISFLSQRYIYCDTNLSLLSYLGYYCPSGSVTETEIICPEAMYCAEGSPAPVKCPAGNYTDQEGAASCDPCPPSYYCIPELIVEGMYIHVPIYGRTYILTSPRCDACIRDLNVVTTTQVLFSGDASTALHDCPLGHYCPEGTGHNPIPCPSGTYSDVLGLGAESECTKCDPGMYCQG